MINKNRTISIDTTDQKDHLTFQRMVIDCLYGCGGKTFNAAWDLPRGGMDTVPVRFETIAGDRVHFSVPLADINLIEDAQ